MPPTKKALRHGHAIALETPTYKSWQAMRVRCRLINREQAANYVGRGIVVCERWASFENFLADMGERPPGKTLDRIDNNGNYEPSNCRWATPAQQRRNSRRRSLTFDQAVQIALRRLSGEPCAAIAADYGISESMPREIAKGRAWSDALAKAMEVRQCSSD